MTYDFDDPNKFEDGYDATAAARAKKNGNVADIIRQNTIKSIQSVRSYISNISEVNKKNFAQFTTQKTVFLVVNGVYLLAGVILFFFCIAIFTNKLDMAKVIMLLKRDVMTILTIASCGQAVLGLFGLYAALKHNKLHMGIYMILLWVVGGLYMADGYIAYKEAHSYQFQMVQSGIWTKLGAQTAVIQKKFQCCGYYSDVDRPYVDSLCAGFVTSISTGKSPTGSVLAKRYVNRQDLGLNEKSVEKRQVVDPNPNIVPSIPGCHDRWVTFMMDWYQFVYYYSFIMIPYTLATFVCALMAANHLYRRNE